MGLVSGRQVEAQRIQVRACLRARVGEGHLGRLCPALSDSDSSPVVPEVAANSHSRICYARFLGTLPSTPVQRLM